jgi:signal transduction histidine kinase/DNA-binding response OmpR family regulator
MHRPPTTQFYKTVILTWITLSLASVVLSGVTWYQLREALRLSRQAVETKDTAEGILRSLLDAETAQRGFSLTGEEDFLEPYLRAERMLPLQFEQLALLAKGDSNLVHQVVQLRARAELSMEHQRRVIAMRREQGAGAAAEIVRERLGKRLMDEIRQNVAFVVAARSAFTSMEARAPRGQLLRGTLTSVIAGAIGLGAGFFAIYLVRKSARDEWRAGEFLHAKLRAESESHQKSTFLANMSHEIRTPMNAIVGFSELLSGELQDTRQRQYLDAIQTSAASLLQIINDILDMSKVEAGLLQLHPEPTDPREVCDFVQTLFTEVTVKRGVKLSCSVADDLPTALLLDRVRLRQILVNLVGNSVKFTERGRIETRIRWERQPPRSSCVTLIIEVEDSGVGIPKAKLHDVFKPFVQAGTHPDMEQSGTGLGLAIVRRLVELMGGSVAVTSVVGHGSLFRLRFPNVAISAQMNESPQAENNDHADFDEFQPARILVVDDNEMNCRLVAGMLESSHHQLEFGRDGQQAVDLARVFRPDVILMDVRMPRMDGRQALRHIRKLKGMESTLIIAVTASGLAEEHRRLRTAFDAYLRKPFTRRALFTVLSQFLRPTGQTVNSHPARVPDGPISQVRAPSDVPVGLMTRLRELQAKEWREVSDGMAMSEARRFAMTLETLGRETGCESLLAYAGLLAHDASAYAVDALEEHLQEFPALLERLEHSAV